MYHVECDGCLCLSESCIMWNVMGVPAYVVAANFDKVRGFDIEDPKTGNLRTGIREQLMVEDTKGRDR